MAQLLNPAAAPDPGRISQILPTVKCSNCNQPVPIHELGDHVCEPAPAMPALKSLVSPLSAIELDPQKIQSKHSFPAQKTVQSHQPVTSHTGSGPNAHVSLTGAPVGIQTRSRALSTSSRRSARTPEPGPSRHDNGASRHPFPAGPASPGPQRVRSPLTGNTPPMPAEVPFPTTRSPSISSRSPTPGRGYPPLVNPLQPPRAPSTPGPRASPPPSLFSGVRPAAHSSPAPSPYTSQPQPPVARQRTPGPPTPSQLSLPAGRSRAASSATTGGYEVIYSTGGNNNSPATASAFPPRFPSNASDHGMQPPRARMPSTSSLPPAQPPLRARAPSTSSVGPHPYSARAQTPSSPGSATGRPSFDRRPSNLANGYPLPPSTPGPPPPPAPTPAPGTVRSPVPKIDTKTGGEAGMAGVGRRGFAAAAAAALFTTAINTHEGSPGTPSPLAFPSQGMDGRRSNAPKLVDVVSATQYGATPPLSPATLSPHSQKSPVSGPQSRTQPTTPTSPGPAPRVATSPGPRLSRGLSNASQRDRHVPPPLEPPKVPLPAVPITTPTTPRLPFFEKFKAQQPPSESPEPIPAARPPSPPSDSDSEYGGLAYANDDDDLDGDMPSPKLLPIDTSVPAQAGPSSGGKIRFPSMASESQYSATSPTSPSMPRRTLSDSRASRGPAKSTGALDRVMETLFEEGTSPLSSPTPKTAPLAPEGQRDSVSRPPKLPVRSHTSPTLGKGAKSSGRQKERLCAKCTKVIEDGRWIQMEGGSVLCDRCWKNMYLPKCRRCNLTIEKQAVSSSDGQLKGKYHRECFNCHKCHKPFPDKTFYVLDGKPFCAYHYHEANRSLCAAASCGQPIEGPCAVSHSGQRYHPEHLLCEHPRCTERLVEYWEVDGRMLCERHAQGAMQEAAEEDDELDDLAAAMEGVRDSVAIRGMKRMTRFIDLGPSELR